MSFNIPPTQTILGFYLTAWLSQVPTAPQLVPSWLEGTGEVSLAVTPQQKKGETKKKEGKKEDCILAQAVSAGCLCFGPRLTGSSFPPFCHTMISSTVRP